MDVDYREALRAAGSIEDLAALCAHHPVPAEIPGAQRIAYRGVLAASGLVPYVQRCGTIRDELETLLADMICDLRHLVDALGADWDEIEQSAAEHHAAELRGE